MKFIRVNGRVVPIKDKAGGGKGLKKSAPKKTAIKKPAGAGYAKKAAKSKMSKIKIPKFKIAPVNKYAILGAAAIATGLTILNKKNKHKTGV